MLKQQKQNTTTTLSHFLAFFISHSYFSFIFHMPSRSQPLQTDEVNTSKELVVDEEEADKMQTDEQEQGQPLSTNIHDGDTTKTATTMTSNSTTSSISPWMFCGLLMIIGSISANVFFFNRSNFAPGKDVHRAWLNYERAVAARQAKKAEDLEAATAAVAAAAAIKSTKMHRPIEPSNLPKDQATLAQQLKNQATLEQHAAEQKSQQQKTKTEDLQPTAVVNKAWDMLLSKFKQR